jgi:PncC family amidohydrolase
MSDPRHQEDYLKAQVTPLPGTIIPPYLQSQQTVRDLLKTVTMTHVKGIVKRLTPAKPDKANTPQLTIGHNLKTATIDYGENVTLRGQLHQALLEVGADFIDTDGDIFKPGFKIQLQEQFLQGLGHPLEREILKLLKEKNLTLATAESATGGLVSSRLTDIRGSSYFVKHNIVTYCNEAKTNALGVDADFLAKEGPYNERTAADMAEGVRKATGAKVGLAFTGLAGCNKWGDDFAGVVFIGLAGLSDKPIVKRVQVDADLPRTLKKQLFSEYGLVFLKHYLQGNLTSDSP